MEIRSSINSFIDDCLTVAKVAVTPTMHDHVIFKEYIKGGSSDGGGVRTQEVQEITRIKATLRNCFPFHCDFKNTCVQVVHYPLFVIECLKLIGKNIIEIKISKLITCTCRLSYIKW